jgi:hypothetical protein
MLQSYQLIQILLIENLLKLGIEQVGLLQLRIGAQIEMNVHINVKKIMNYNQMVLV